MNAKKINFLTVAFVLLVFALGVCVGAGWRGAANTGGSIGTEGRAAEIRRAHTELGDEQRANSDRIERIIGLTEKTGRDVRELRESNRRSGDLLSLLEQEVDILEGYLDNIERELAGYRRDGVGNNPAVEIGE